MVQKESHFLEVCRYVVLNPVRAKAGKHPKEWTWSSYRATAGQSPIPRYLTVDEILGYFRQRRGACQEKYREYVREGIGSATIREDLERRVYWDWKTSLRRCGAMSWASRPYANTEGAKTSRETKPEESVL